MDKRKKIPKQIHHFIEKYRIYGANHKLYKKVAEDLQAQFGEIPSVEDIEWRLYQHMLDILASIPDFQALSYLYTDMAVIRYRISKLAGDQDMEEANNYRLLYLKSLNCDEVEIINNLIDTCLPCNTVSGKRFSIEEALITMPLPPEGCVCFSSKFGYCTCMYLAIYKS